MRIENHQFVPVENDPIQITYEQGGAGPIIKPELIVIHYGVTHSLPSLVAAQKARGYWAHLSVDGLFHEGRSDMRLVQQLPFNRRGSHAGKSSWKGREGVNGFSVGIEICNPGPLIEQPDGSLETVYGKHWMLSEAVQIEPPQGYPKNWRHWARYTDEEMGVLVAVCLALKAEYGIQEIVGHSDIAPGRKFDPGPAFPLDYLRRSVFPEQYAKTEPPDSVL